MAEIWKLWHFFPRLRNFPFRRSLCINSLLKGHFLNWLNVVSCTKLMAPPFFSSSRDSDADHEEIWKVSCSERQSEREREKDSPPTPSLPRDHAVLKTPLFAGETSGLLAQILPYKGSGRRVVTLCLDSPRIVTVHRVFVVFWNSDVSTTEM